MFFANTQTSSTEVKTPPPSSRYEVSNMSGADVLVIDWLSEVRKISKVDDANTPNVAFSWLLNAGLHSRKMTSPLKVVGYSLDGNNIGFKLKHPAGHQVEVRGAWEEFKTPSVKMAEA